MYELVLLAIELMEKKLKWRIINKHTHKYTSSIEFTKIDL